MLTPAAARAFAAIGVRMPPGCTTETLTVLVAQRLAEAAHRELARGIGRLAGRGNDAEDAREVDDMRVVLLLQDGQEQLHAMHHAPEIDADEPGDVVEAELGHRADHGDAGIVDEQRDAPVLAQHGVAEFLHRRGIGDVDLMHRDANAGLARRGRALGETGGIDVAQRQHAALLRKPQRERAANAAGGAGDDGNSAGEGAHR
ncbi:MAG TPA: hypothetical protein VF930_14345 [Stellaceae bacterium]